MNSSCDAELDNDTGYSSHDSSCLQEDGSDKSWRQNPQGVSKDVSCEDSPSEPIIDWSYNEDDSMQGLDEVEDLLYHFEKFFREKLEHHVKDFTTSMQIMFSEQQIHVRQIVNSTFHGHGYQDGDLLTELEEQDVTLKSTTDVLDVQ
ncbi:uncharacterized protein LOC124290569 [Haliotis rubra]|uniref:uncharacterized protein LOC124290569 n=1 Tax=Haliotis rubra TaxID=36100 RepID=UPI001EE54A04|nr:uncharacterized protein LOC124290569 [Haliotis rubra]